VDFVPELTSLDASKVSDVDSLVLTKYADDRTVTSININFGELFRMNFLFHQSIYTRFSVMKLDQFDPD
jgi:hypothetical protein